MLYAEKWNFMEAGMSIKESDWKIFCEIKNEAIPYKAQPALKKKIDAKCEGK